MHRIINLSATAFATYGTMKGRPAAVVRGVTSAEGLPIGVQIIAHPWREGIALAVAGYLEKTLGGFQPPRYSIRRPNQSLVRI